MPFKTVKVFDNIAEASIYKNILENENFNVYLFDDQTVSINPLMSNAIGGIKLKVDANDFDKVSFFLNEFEKKPLIDSDNQIITCPKCNSNEIDDDFKNIYTSKGIISFVLSLLFMVYPIYFKRMRKCKKCGHKFSYQKN